MQKFTRGHSTFTCSACGRLTRLTGTQSVGSDLCPQDYELAGIYNVHQDGGDVLAYANDIVHYTNEIKEKGGTLDGDALELLGIVASLRAGA